MGYLKTIDVPKERVGRSIRIDNGQIEIARYEIPSSSYSSGTAETYPTKDYKIGSESYKEVVHYFGEQIAKEALDYINKNH